MTSTFTSPSYVNRVKESWQPGYGVTQSGGAGSPTLYFDFMTGVLNPAITFTRASTATFFNSAGVLTSASTNAPRFDYNPSTLAARGLLIEESRANLLTYSAEFDNAAWGKSNSSVTANTVTAPDGNVTADKLVENTASNTHIISQAISGITASSTITVTVFAKFDSSNRTFGLQFTDAPSGGTQYAGMRLLQNGTAVALDTGFSNRSFSVTPVGNGWYRCSMTITTSSVTTITVRMYICAADGSVVYTGDGTSGVYVWGAQLEAGAFPTSYIPTTTTALTRAADVASVNTLSPWYNATEGTLFVQALRGGDVDATIATFSIGSTTADRIQIHSTTSSEYRATYRTGNVEQAALLLSSSTNSPKIAATIKTNDLAASINGASPQTDTTASIAAYDTLWIGRRSDADVYWNGHVQRITYYPRRLANADLQAITA